MTTDPQLKRTAQSGACTRSRRPASSLSFVAEVDGRSSESVWPAAQGAEAGAAPDTPAYTAITRQLRAMRASLSRRLERIVTSTDPGAGGSSRPPRAAAAASRLSKALFLARSGIACPWESARRECGQEKTHRPPGLCADAAAARPDKSVPATARALLEAPWPARHRLPPSPRRPPPP